MAPDEAGEPAASARVNGFFTALAGHARTHPGSELTRWWPAGRCQQTGAFAEPDDDVAARAYTPRSRPDGHGIWVEGDRRLPFFLSTTSAPNGHFPDWSTRSTATGNSRTPPAGSGRSCSGCTPRNGSGTYIRNSPPPGPSTRRLPRARRGHRRHPGRGDVVAAPLPRGVDAFGQPPVGRATPTPHGGTTLMSGKPTPTSAPK
nr:replication-relaxation family protein [Micromonospora taraxaci]